MMHWLDWTIIGLLAAVLIAVPVASRRMIKSTADFLAANRCAGRYVIAVASGIAGLGAISIVSFFEMYYTVGFVSMWWSFLTTPVALLVAMSGWVYYRFRRSRCLTMAQYFEVRYSRNFRIFSGIVAWISGIVNYGIFPAVSVRFFMTFCGLPDAIAISGFGSVGVYPLLLALAIGLGAGFAILGGQVSIMITDFIQGVFCNMVFLVLIFFFAWKFNWIQIGEAMTADAVLHPGGSRFNPYDIGEMRDFNIWFYLVGIFSALYSAGTWQGEVGYRSAAINAHEAQMGNILGSLRGVIQTALFLFIPVCAFVFFSHADFAADSMAAAAQADAVAEFALRNQARVPLFLAHILPVGLMGLFAAMMFAAMLSTDNTYMHSWGSIFIQDVVLPFRRKPFPPRVHLWLLRGSIVFVGMFTFAFSMLFRQTEYIGLFFQITGAIFIGGAGAVVIGGLYTRIGTTAGAWAAMIGGSSLAVSGILLQQAWVGHVAPFLAGRFGWQWVIDHPDRFPVNGQFVFFFACAAGLVLYFGVSLLDRALVRRPLFNLDRALHRGRYDTRHENVIRGRGGREWLKIIGISDESTFGDKVVCWISVGWGALWLLVFIVGTVFQKQFSSAVWLGIWKWFIVSSCVFGSITTVWFLLGGIVDVRKMFRLLKSAVRNANDDGTVIDGFNADEVAPVRQVGEGESAL